MKHLTADGHLADDGISEWEHRAQEYKDAWYASDAQVRAQQIELLKLRTENARMKVLLDTLADAIQHKEKA